MKNEKLNKLAEDILQQKHNIREWEESIKEEKQKLETMQDMFIKELNKQGLRSVSYGSHYLAATKRKNIKIKDDKAALTQIKRRGWKDCLVERIDKTKFNKYAKKAMEEGKKLSGVELEEKEYLLVKEKKEQ